MSQELAINNSGEDAPAGGAATLYSNAAGMYYLRKPLWSNDPAARALLQDIPDVSSGFIGTIGIQRCLFTGPTPDPGDRIGCIANSWHWQKDPAGNMMVEGTLPGNIALASPNREREGYQEWP